MMQDPRQHSEACLRNQGPISELLSRLLPSPEPRKVLEIGSGTGQHAVAFSERLPHLEWQPTDRPEYHPSIEAWRQVAGLENLKPVLAFDLFDPLGSLPSGEAMVAINVLHIAPEPASERLFAHAAQSLPTGGLLFVYGPFRYPDQPLAPSNLAFEQYLQSIDPQRGIRHIEHLDAYAHAHGFTLGGDEALPANNHARWWFKR